MIVVNLFGGPGVGKSTVAAMLFGHYKRRGLRVELAREQAKEFLYQGRPLARNQLLMIALQYQMLKDIEAAGTELVISDSALRLNLSYSCKLPYYQPLAALIRGLCLEFTEVDVLLKRAVPYQFHGREQGEESAREIDARMIGHFDLVLESPAPMEVIARLDPLVLPLVVKQ
jgi:hypothetical protein